jgi:hypothetical protein
MAYETKMQNDLLPSEHQPSSLYNLYKDDINQCRHDQLYRPLSSEHGDADQKPRRSTSRRAVVAGKAEESEEIDRASRMVSVEIFGVWMLLSSAIELQFRHNLAASTLLSQVSTCRQMAVGVTDQGQTEYFRYSHRSTCVAT